MRFDVITLFAELFAPHTAHGVTRRAFASGQVAVKLWPLRDFGQGPHQRVDDRPFGGGPGMVMQAPVLAAALAAVRAERALAAASAGSASPSDGAPLIVFSPAGQPLTQALVRELAAGAGAVLLCGRYEGIDQRFLDRERPLLISLGDFVLSGGEIPALALLDAVARLQDGVLHDPESHQQDSFGLSGLLDCPHYTQPAVWEGTEVPAVLTSGHHAHIERWRREQALRATAEARPDLVVAARQQGLLTRADEVVLANLPHGLNGPQHPN
jgi:tRNA (guanine37-N1)-methyltransferase